MPKAHHQNASCAAESGGVALMLPFAQPMGYGLGKSGWASANFENEKKIPVDMLIEWIREIYLAVAAKKLAATLDAKPPTKSNRT